MEPPVSKEQQRRWTSIRVPLAYVLVTLFGLLATAAVPGIVRIVALPSAALVQGSLATAFEVAWKLIAYSFFPPDLTLWFEVSGGVVLLSLMANDGITARGYVGALASGALAGGLGFVFTGPEAVLVGPVMPLYGLLGACCVFARQRWHLLGWLARAYSVLLFLVAAGTIFGGVAVRTPTRPAEALALCAGIFAGVFALAPDWSRRIAETSHPTDPAGAL